MTKNESGAILEDENIKAGLNLTVTIKDMEVFRVILDLLARIMLDERIDKVLRMHYLSEMLGIAGEIK